MSLSSLSGSSSNPSLLSAENSQSTSQIGGAIFAILSLEEIKNRISQLEKQFQEYLLMVMEGKRFNYRFECINGVLETFKTFDTPLEDLTAKPKVVSLQQLIIFKTHLCISSLFKSNYYLSQSFDPLCSFLRMSYSLGFHQLHFTMQGLSPHLRGAILRGHRLPLETLIRQRVHADDFNENDCVKELELLTALVGEKKSRNSLKEIFKLYSDLCHQRKITLELQADDRLYIYLSCLFNFHVEGQRDWIEDMHQACLTFKGARSLQTLLELIDKPLPKKLNRAQFYKIIDPAIRVPLYNLYIGTPQQSFYFLLNSILALSEKSKSHPRSKLASPFNPVKWDLFKECLYYINTTTLEDIPMFPEGFKLLNRLAQIHPLFTLRQALAVLQTYFFPNPNSQGIEKHKKEEKEVETFEEMFKKIKDDDSKLAEINAGLNQCETILTTWWYRFNTSHRQPLELLADLITRRVLLDKGYVDQNPDEAIQAIVHSMKKTDFPLSIEDARQAYNRLMEIVERQ